MTSVIAAESAKDEAVTIKSDIQNDPYDINKCAKWIDAHALEKVCLQFPDALLPDSTDVALSLENLVGNKVYILGDTTCGSCCVDEIAAQHVNSDGIIHFGHSCLNPTDRLPVFHVLPKKEIDTSDLCNKFKQIFQDNTKRILFFYDVGYAHKIEHIYKELQCSYTNLILSKLNCVSNVEFTDSKVDSSAVVLGRSYTIENSYKVEDYEAFFLGDNDRTFFTLSISIPAKKWYHLENNNIVEFQVSKTSWLKRRRYLVEKLKDAKVVGIVVATLGIKEYLKAITRIKSILKEKNKKCYILSVGKINPAKLANFPEIDAFVVITCPENELFDSRDFLRPMLMPYEVEIAFNAAREHSTQYCIDFRQILPGGTNYVDFKSSTDSDVSLITGEIRSSEKDALLCSDKMNALMIPSEGTVAIGKAGAQYLHQRSWKGLEQNLGGNPVKAAEIGRSGLPSCYENEPLAIDNENKHCAKN